MSQQHYAYRIWRVWPDGALWQRGPVLTSAAFWDDRILKRWSYRRAGWDTKTLVAKCQKLDHRAPNRYCTCGIYAYPDLLDVLPLLNQYCEDSMYAIGLVAGYGGVRNDGAVIAHDACMRFAETDIVAFAKLGSAWRGGLLDQLATRMDVPVLPLEEIEAIAATGARVSRKDNRPVGARYPDEIDVGEMVSVARSAIIADRWGGLYVRNDREVRKPSRNHQPNQYPNQSRMWIKREQDGRFKVSNRMAIIDAEKFVLLPFDGEVDLASSRSRLAGRVSSVDIGSFGYPKTKVDATPDARDTVVLPNVNRLLLLDLMKPGERLAVSGWSAAIDRGGSARIGRVLTPPQYSEFPHFYLRKIDERSHALEIETDHRFFRLRWPISTRATRQHDTPAGQILFNGQALPGARIPREWNKGLFLDSFPAALPRNDSNHLGGGA